MAKQKLPAATQAAPVQSATVTSFPPRRILELVRPQSNADVVELLRALLRRAEAGEVSGLIAVPLFARNSGPKKYGVSLAGTARENPQLAVGAMDVCQMLLREIALKDAGIG